MIIHSDLPSKLNEGNFREIIKFRIESGDKKLENHLKNTSFKATNISKTTQNEIIFFCSKLIIDSIINKVKWFPYYVRQNNRYLTSILITYSFTVYE